MKHFSLFFILLALLFLASCGNFEPEPETTAHWTLIPTPTPQNAEAPEPETESIDLSCPLFSLSLPEFIARYNAVYAREYDFTPLPLASDWDELTPQDLLHLWRFVGDPTLSAEPAMLVWAEDMSAPIRRICLDFSDHGYTDENRDRYEKLCRCAFLCAGMDADAAGRLFDTLFALAMDESYASGDYDAPEIKTLYHDGTIGLYAWYSEGIAHMDMIPVTPEYIDSAAQNGTECVDFRGSGE